MSHLIHIKSYVCTLMRGRTLTYTHTNSSYMRDDDDDAKEKERKKSFFPDGE